MRILLCVLLGVVTSVGVAWWIVLVEPDELNWPYTQPVRVSGWPAPTTADSWPSAPDLGTVFTRPGSRRLAVTVQIGPRTYSQMVSAYGWPFTVLEYELHTHFDEMKGLSHRAVAAIQHKSEESNPLTAYLPLRPLYLGLLANTCIYACAWHALVVAPGVFIRWRRRRAGRCVTCGYDLRKIESNACPECGAVTRERRRRARSQS